MLGIGLFLCRPPLHPALLVFGTVIIPSIICVFLVAFMASWVCILEQRLFVKVVVAEVLGCVKSNKRLKRKVKSLAVLHWS